MDAIRQIAYFSTFLMKKMLRNVNKAIFIILAGLNLLLLIAAMTFALQPHPFWDMEWIYEGIVSDVAFGSPAEKSGFQQGQQLLSVAGKTPQSMPILYPAQFGDELEIQVMYEGKIKTLSYQVTPTPLSYRIFLFERPFIGLIFWGVSLLMWILRPPHRVRWAFIFAGQAAAALFSLIVLRISPFGVLLSNPFEALLAALVIVNYALFPEPLSEKRVRNLHILAVVLAIVVWLSTVFVVFYRPELQKEQFYTQEFLVNLGFLTGLILLLNRGKLTDIFRQQQRRLVLGGMFLGLLPLLLFYRFPQLLLGHALLSSEIIYPFLALIPLSYAYALYQGNLGRADALLRRTLVYSGIGLLFIGLYSALFFGIYELLPTNSWLIPTSFALLSIGALYVLPAIRGWLNHKIDILFYGNWYDYRSLVKQSMEEWRNSTTLAELSVALRHFLETMRFRQGALIVQEKNGELFVYPLFEEIPFSSLDVSVLKGMPPFDKHEIFLSLYHAQSLQGYLWAQERPKDLLLDENDRELLSLLAERSAMALANIQLLDELRDKLAAEHQMRIALGDAQKRLAESREAERLYLAQELHDGPLQLLYSAKHLIEVGKTAEAASLIVETGDKIRTVCTTLRPPLLERFGLEVALYDWIRKRKTEVPIEAHLMAVKCNAETALALFRIAQESIQNALKHAHPTRIQVRLESDAEGILLLISDDGKGIPMAALEGNGDRYGLLGMKERAQSIGTTLQIDTSQNGTSISVFLPEKAE